MTHTYTFKGNLSHRDFKIICQKIKKDCPGYTPEERESLEDRIERVRWTKGEMEIRGSTQ